MRQYSVLFDIEGTLVDSVPLTLTCWRETLADVGYVVPRDSLQRYSGMDGGDMLKALLPEIEKPKIKTILKAQAERFERIFLGEVKPFPGLREVLRDLAESRLNIALATDCKGPALQRYREIMDIDDLVHAVACGDEVEEGKPNPSVIAIALSKLRADHTQARIVGDTPYDAQAAARKGVASVGMLTGGFGKETLLKAGCMATAATLAGLSTILIAARMGSK